MTMEKHHIFHWKFIFKRLFFPFSHEFWGGVVEQWTSWNKPKQMELRILSRSESKNHIASGLTMGLICLHGTKLEGHESCMNEDYQLWHFNLKNIAVSLAVFTSWTRLFCRLTIVETLVERLWTVWGLLMDGSRANTSGSLDVNMLETQETLQKLQPRHWLRAKKNLYGW